MTLPFTADQFFDVFAAYNRTFWLMVAGLWLASAGVVLQLLRGRASWDTTTALTAFHWFWAGVAYHVMFFTTVNPVAPLFGLAFVAQAVALVWYGAVHGKLQYGWKRDARHVTAAILLIYSLLYPALVVLSGDLPPRAPLFGVPCPTTIFTAGVLLSVVDPVPRPLLVVPIVWSLIGGSAALLFGVAPDYILFVVAVVLTALALTTHSHETSSPVPAAALPGSRQKLSHGG
jgi:hypothetical protein